MDFVGARCAVMECRSDLFKLRKSSVDPDALGHYQHVTRLLKSPSKDERGRTEKELATNSTHPPPFHALRAHNNPPSILYHHAVDYFIAIAGRSARSSAMSVLLHRWHIAEMLLRGAS